MSKIIDTHCHVQDPKYSADQEAVLHRAREVGVAMICIGTDLDMSRRAVELASLHADIWAAIGLHPNDNLDETYDQVHYQELATHPRVVAIGEIGLDYYRTTEATQRDFQCERFVQQLDLAKAVRKPVVIHCRDAHEDMTELLRVARASLPPYPGVIHSFTGSSEHAAAYLELGFCIGLNGILTFTDQYDEMVKTVPLDRILLETDAPYLAPVPYRGKRNEPAHVVEVTKRIVDLKGLPLDDVIATTTATAKTLFSLDIKPS